MTRPNSSTMGCSVADPPAQHVVVRLHPPAAGLEAHFAIVAAKSSLWHRWKSFFESVDQFQSTPPNSVTTDSGALTAPMLC